MRIWVFLGLIPFAPKRGILAVALNHYQFQNSSFDIGLLSLALGQPIYEPKTRRLYNAWDIFGLMEWSQRSEITRGKNA